MYPEPVAFAMAVAEVARTTFKNRVALTESQMILTGAAEAVEQSVTRSLAQYWRRTLTEPLDADSNTRMLDDAQSERPRQRRRVGDRQAQAIADEPISLTPFGEEQMRRSERERARGSDQGSVFCFLAASLPGSPHRALL